MGFPFEPLDFLLVVSLSFCQDMGEPCSGWFQNIRNGHCYRKFCDEKKFDAAQKICERYGGYLPFIRTEQEDKFVATLTRSGTKKINALGWEMKSPQNHWIGIRRQKDRKWKFLNGTDISYFSWQPGEPNNKGGNENCVHYAPIFSLYWEHWNDLDCDNRDVNTYICERDSCVNT